MPAVTHEDHDAAGELARLAGQLLVGLRESMGFADPAALRAAGDRKANDLLVAALAERFPGDGVLSEEAPSGPERLDLARVWIVDPLDGTREFGEEGRTDWAVHVALTLDGDPVAGAVALPARSLVLSTAAPAVAPAPASPLRIAVSRSRPPALCDEVASSLGATLVPMGSAGAKVMAVVLGDADVYLHAGGQYEWDSCAPVAVARAAGLSATRIDGAPLRYNTADAWLPDLLVCRPELLDRVLGAVAAAG